MQSTFVLCFIDYYCFFAALLSPSPKKGVSACSVATWQAHLAYCLVASCEHGFVSFIEPLFQTLLLSIGYEKGRGHFRGSLSKLHSAIYFDLGVVYVFSELGYNIRGGAWNCTLTLPWIASRWVDGMWRKNYDDFFRLFGRFFVFELGSQQVFFGVTFWGQRALKSPTVLRTR